MSISEKSKKISIVIPVEVFDKITYYAHKEKIRSFSAMASKLLSEAVEKYPDPDEPKLPL